MSQGLAFLIWLLCVAISAVLIGYFLKNSSSPKKEGFVVKTCPPGTNSFVNDSGDTLCCNGDVVDGYCTGNLRCTLSPNSNSGLPTCTDLVASEAMLAGSGKCPLEMPNYFAYADGSRKGCSVSPINYNGTAPSDENQPQCILYPTQALDEVKLDSCYNVLKNAKREAEFAALEAKANDPTCSAARSAVENAQATARAARAAQAAKAVQDASVQAAQAIATVAAAQAASGTGPGSASCAPSNSTGYTMSGTEISGSIPVGMIVSDGTFKIYLAQNNNRAAVLVLQNGQASNAFSINASLPETQAKDIGALEAWFRQNNNGFQAGNYTVTKV